MSRLHEAPTNSSSADILKWFNSLSEDDMTEVIRDVVTIVSEMRTLLLNAIIPVAHEEGIGLKLRNEITASMITVIQRLGMAILSEGAAALLSPPVADVPEVPEK